MTIAQIPKCAGIIKAKVRHFCERGRVNTVKPKTNGGEIRLAGEFLYASKLVCHYSK